MKTLGERIIYCRLRARFQSGTSVSQEELGKLVAKLLLRDQPVSGATVSRWESGEFQPDLSSITAIAEVGGVAPGWLAFGDGHGWVPSERPVRKALEVSQPPSESASYLSLVPGAFYSTDSTHTNVLRAKRKSPVRGYLARPKQAKLRPEKAGAAPKPPKPPKPPKRGSKRK